MTSQNFPSAQLMGVNGGQLVGHSGNNQPLIPLILNHAGSQEREPNRLRPTHVRHSGLIEL